jgi:hypothetical protein
MGDQFWSGTLGNFLGGLLVALIFFAADSVKSRARSKAVKHRRVMAAKAELSRVHDQAKSLAADPTGGTTVIDFSFVRLLVADSLADESLDLIAGPISSMQAAVDRLNGLRLQLLFETSGTASTVIGNESKVQELVSSVETAAIALQAECVNVAKHLSAPTVDSLPASGTDAPPAK